jgi:hypothetical protein
MFHLDISKVDLVLHMLQWLYTHVSSVSSVFRRMLHMFHLDVLKIDRVLHGVGGWRRTASTTRNLSSYDIFIHL